MNDSWKYLHCNSLFEHKKIHSILTRSLFLTRLFIISNNVSFNQHAIKSTCEGGGKNTRLQK